MSETRTLFDITALRENEERYRFIAELIPQIVWTARADGWIDYDNPRWYEFTGLDPEKGVGWGWESVIHPDDLAEVDRRWKEAIRSGVGYTIEYRLRRFDGVYIWHLDRAIPIRDSKGNVKRWFGTCTDVEYQKRIESALRESEKRLAQLNGTLEKTVQERTRELRKTEEELFQTQKLEAIGRLAGGVAHDFNNLLTGIRGTAEAVKQDLPPSDPKIAELDEMETAIDRAFSLIRQLLAFSRHQVAQPRILNMNTVIEDMAKMLQRLIGEHITIDVSSRDSAWVVADPSQIEQLLMNLALNARDAMPGGGLLSIRTETLTLSESGSRIGFQMAPGSYVLLEVRDTGEGMDEDVLSHIFEPFFTTKASDRGSGLGLSTVYGIVKQNGGDIRVESALGRGTTFYIVFPASPSPLQTQPSAPDSLPKSPLGRQETVMVVEDEPLVRRMVARQLEKNGYRVITAGSSFEALQRARTCLEEIDLVVSDVVMPEMNGHELCQKLLTQKPDLHCLYMSAYPREIVGLQNKLDPSIQFIDKSILHTDLLSRVREVLDISPRV